MDKLEFRLETEADGNPIHLGSMSVHAASVFASIIKSLTEIVENTPGGDQIKISIREGSAAVEAIGPEEKISELFDGYSLVVSKQATSKAIVDNWRNLQNHAKSNGIAYEMKFERGGQSIDLQPQIKEAPQFRVKPTTFVPEFVPFFIHGKMLSLGGKKTNLHIEDAGEEITTISCTEPQVLRLKKHLRNRVYISGWKGKKGEDKYTIEYCDIYTNEAYFVELKDFFLQQGELTLSESLYRLHHKIKDYLNAKEFGLVKKMYRILMHKSTHPSKLMTALIISKSFRDSEELGPAIDELKLFLEGLLKEPLL